MLPTNKRTRTGSFLSPAGGRATALGIGLALTLSLSGGGRALAAPPAKSLYDKGATEYNLGHFAEAIANFEKAYELDPAPILLFNIAQSHRQSGNNERALFFYRRYLEQAAPDASNRPDVEKRAKELEEVLAQQSEIKRKPPTQVEDREHHTPPAGAMTPAPALSPAGAPATNPAPLAPPPLATPQIQDSSQPKTPPPDTVGVTTTAPAPESTEKPFRVGADMGVAFSQFHGRTLDQPGQFALRLFGGYLVTSLPFPVEVGAAFAFSPLPYKADTIDASGSHSVDKTATLTGLWVRAAALVPLPPGFDLVGELGLGVVWWGGIETGNPFTKDSSAASGAIPMPSFRLAVGARYPLPSGFFVYVLPAFSMSKPTSGLGDSISSVTRFELPLGLGLTF